MKRKTLKRKISIVGILVFVSMIVYSCWQDEWSSNVGSPDKPGGLSIQLCKSEKKEFYIRYSS